MEDWQVEQITAHLPKLIRLTDCNAMLLSILQAKKLLSIEDVERIQAKETSHDCTKLLYEILLSRCNSYQVLIEALLETRQSGAAAILQKFPWDKVANLRVNFLGKVYSVNELLDCEQIRQVYQWLQENLSVEKSSKINETLFKSECVLELVRNTIPDSDPLYIHRFLSRRLAIYSGLFLKDCQDIFVFKNIDRLTLRPFVGSNGIDLSTEQILSKKMSSRFILLQRDAHWEKIVKKVTTPTPTHLIKFEVETEEFVLEATSGCSEILNEYLQQKTRSDAECLSEEQFLEMSLSGNGSGFCICDTPGMGKSLLLANIARTIKTNISELIVAFIRLRAFDMSSKESCRDKILEYVSTSALAFALLQEVTAKSPQKFALFFDGLDEVHPEKLELAIKFLQNVIREMPEARVYISARPVMRQGLERVTKTIPYDILPFDKTTQLNFLASVWKQEHSSGNLESFKEYATHCLEKLNKSLTKKESEISGVPLLCRMIADVFVDEAFVYADGDLSNEYLKNFGRFKNTLLEVYVKFVERQLGDTVCNFECLSNNCVTLNCSNNCKVRSFHVWCAIQLIFPKLASKICKHVNKFEDLSKQEILTPGLLQQITKADTCKLQFAHRTYAEFLVAEFFAKAIFTETSFWKQRNFESWVTIEIFATVSLSFPGLEEISDRRFRENVVAYFLNAFITERSQSLNILNTASLPVTHKRFLRPAAACLIFDFDGLLEILFGAASGYGTLPKRSTFELPDETADCLEIASRYCRASTITKFANFYLARYNVNLFEEYATNWKYISIFKKVLKRADHKVTQVFINSIQLHGHGFLFACLDCCYLDDEELLEKKLDIAKLILDKCPQLISETRSQFQVGGPLFAFELHLKAIQFLIQNGADVLAKDGLNRTVVHQAAEYMSVVELQKACEIMFVGCSVDEFLAVFGNPSKILWKGRGQGQSEQCRRHGKLLIGALHLASTGVSSVSPKDFTQVWTVAMDETNDSHLNLLVDILRQPELCQKYDQTLTNLFQIAVGEGDLSVVSSLLNYNPFLLELKFDCSFVRDEFVIGDSTYGECAVVKETPVHVALHYGELEMFQFLDSKSADIFVVDSDGNNILHKAAENMNCEQFHRVLETVGRHWEKFPNYGESLKTCLCELFNQKDKNESQTPLHMACQRLDLSMETLNLYLACGNMAAPVENVPLFNINAADGSGQTLLMLALSRGKVDLARCLLSRGASFSGKDLHGQTVAHICAENNLFEETKLALESGCNVNELDDNGNNVLQAEIKCGHALSRELVQLLIDFGVDKRNKNKDGRTAYDYAIRMPERYSFDILQILKPE